MIANTNRPEAASYVDIAHAEAIAMENQMQMRSIDKYYGPRRGTNGSGAERRDKVKRSPNTLHDLAQTNPFVHKLLVDAQKAGLL